MHLKFSVKARNIQRIKKTLHYLSSVLYNSSLETLVLYHSLFLLVCSLTLRKQTNKHTTKPLQKKWQLSLLFFFSSKEHTISRS